MGKIAKIGLAVVGVAINVIPGVGQALSAAIIGTLGGTFAAAGIAFSAVGLISSVGLMSALSMGASLLAPRPKAPKVSPASAERLTATIDPRTPRKIVIGGPTAMSTDIRDQEFTGDQEYLHRFIVVASHKVASIQFIYFDDKLAWRSDSGVQGEFVGYLTVTPVLEGNAGNAINISPRMGSSRRYTGLAYVHLRYKLTGNTKKTESPFSQSIASRMTIVGEGAFVYDPRLDSTVPGGSGSHRANDQATWAFVAGRNPAIQLLWYLLGWRINGKLAVGKGIPPERIDLESFITAANLCDEPVTLAAGGTEPRYRSDGVFSEGDSPTTVIDNLKAAMNATLDDMDGKIRLTVLHNDLAAPITDFDNDDIIGMVRWQQTQPLDQSFNILRGTYVDPSPNSLYQMVDYPQVALESPDGIDRIETIDFALVQSASQAQRLAKQRLQRAQYGGMFSAEFQATAWKVQKGDVVRQTFSALGFTNKLFRVVDMTVRVDGVVPMTLREEHEDIYAWDAEDSPAVQAADPTVYDPLAPPPVPDPGLWALSAIIAGDGLPALLVSGISEYAGAQSVVVEYRRVGDVDWISAGQQEASQQVNLVIPGLISATSYEARVANRSANGVSDWLELGPVTTGIGTVGSKTALVYIFRRSATAPVLPSATTTYDFGTNSLTGLNNGWSATPPASDGNPLYVAVATASGTGSTDTIASGEWSSPVISATDGASGINAATVFLYQRNNTGTPPAAPDNDITYFFATAATTGSLDGWSRSVPSDANGPYIFVTTATAAGTGSSDVITPSEWATVRTMAASGMSVREVTVYKRSASAPATPSGGSYNFGTGVLTPPSTWLATYPTTGSDPVYAASGVAAIVGLSGSDVPDWLGVGRVASDGSAVNVIFQRAASVPSTPAASAGVPSLWYDDVADVPDGPGQIYSSFGTRANAGANWTWQLPVQVEGVDGATLGDSLWVDPGYSNLDGNWLAPIAAPFSFLTGGGFLLDPLLRMTTTPTGDREQLVGEFPVRADQEKIWWGFVGGRVSGSGFGGLFARFYDSAGIEVGSKVELITNQTMTLGGSSYPKTGGTFLTPSTAAYVRYGFIKKSTLTSPANFHVGMPYIQRTQPGANVTEENQSEMDGPDVLTVDATSAGAIYAGQIPISFAFTRRHGGVDVTASTTWTIEGTPWNCSVSIGASTGIGSVTAVQGPAWFWVLSTYNGMPKRQKVDIAYNYSLIPSGAVVGELTQSEVTATSAGTGPVIFGPLTIDCPSAELTWVMNLPYFAAAAGSGVANIVIQHRPTPGSGSWAALLTIGGGSVPYNASDQQFENVVASSVNFSSADGIDVGTNEIRLVAYKSGTSSKMVLRSGLNYFLGD